MKGTTVMTVRPRPADGNLPGGHENETRPAAPAGQPPSAGRPPLLTQRAAIIFIAALAIGIAAGILAYLAGARPAAAVLTGGGAFAAAITLLETLIG